MATIWMIINVNGGGFCVDERSLWAQRPVAHTVVLYNKGVDANAYKQAKRAGPSLLPHLQMKNTQLLPADIQKTFNAGTRQFIPQKKHLAEIAQTRFSK